MIDHDAAARARLYGPTVNRLLEEFVGGAAEAGVGGLCCVLIDGQGEVAVVRIASGGRPGTVERRAAVEIAALAVDMARKLAQPAGSA